MIRRSKLVCACLLAMLLPALPVGAQQENEYIEKVYVMFKTHLDVGFTDLSSVVTQRYVDNFIPQALDVADKLDAEGNGERYVWTTGSWLIWKYLRNATPAQTERLEKAIRRGDIVWNAVPYTVESEMMSRDLFESSLLTFQHLDKKYGKHTIAAKMTDVPGHTRSIIAPLAKAGIKFLHIGVNPATPIPAVPEICRWQDPEGNEVILMYQQDYGTGGILPDGKTAVAVNFTGDNHGPHSYEQVKAIYANLHKQYPNARLIPSSFNDLATELISMKDGLPVVTSEIGDTWIYGFGGSPIRMARFRALQALYSRWLKEGRIDPNSDSTMDFVLELGLVAEHTQGVDVKTHLCHWDKYDVDVFEKSRRDGCFRMAEASWRELDDYLTNAIDYLPEALRPEALKVIGEAAVPHVPAFTEENSETKLFAPWHPEVMKRAKVKIGGLTYQTLDSKDYDRFFDTYMRAKYGWALLDFGKYGLDQSKAVSASMQADVVRQETERVKDGILTKYELAFLPCKGVDRRVLPGKVYVEIKENKKGDKAEVAVTLLDKPAVRLPEAYWLSFSLDDITGIVAEKTGGRVNVMDVVERGARRMHAIDRYVDLVTDRGTLRIWSETAFLVNVGKASGLDYSTEYPDMQGGIHFNLSNNLWGTNFTMWNEGSLTYRFTLEWTK